MEANSTEDGGCLGLILILATIAIVVTAFPFGLFLVLSIGLHFWCSEQKNLFIKALHNTILPLIPALFMLALLTISSRFFLKSDPLVINRIENFFIEFRLTVKPYLNLTLLTFMMIIGSVLLLNIALNQYKIVSRYLTIQKYATRLLIALTAIVSFTFFSSTEGENLLAVEYSMRIEKLKVNFREDLEIQGQYIAAKKIENELQQITPQDASHYVESFQSLALLDAASRRAFMMFGRNEKIPSTEAVFSYLFLDRQIKDISQTEKYIQESISKEIQKFKIPTTTQERNQQEKTVLESKVKLNESKKVLTEAVKAVEAVFVASLGELAPEIKSIAKIYVNKLIQETSKRVFSLANSTYEPFKRLELVNYAESKSETTESSMNHKKVELLRLVGLANKIDLQKAMEETKLEQEKYGRWGKGQQGYEKYRPGSKPRPRPAPRPTPRGR